VKRREGEMQQKYEVKYNGKRVYGPKKIIFQRISLKSCEFSFRIHFGHPSNAVDSIYLIPLFLKEKIRRNL
jgi:hypothetical protein